MQTRASKLGLDVLGGLHSKRIQLQCRRCKHTSSISYNKKLEQLSCLKCRANEKEQMREQLRREEQLNAQRLISEQESFFAEAKMQMNQELTRNSSFNSSNLRCDNFSSLEEQINLRANSLAKQFIASLSSTDRQNDKLSFDKVFLCLKLNETSSDMLLEGLKMMGDSD